MDFAVLFAWERKWMDPVWTQDGLRMDSRETLERPGIDPGGTRDRPGLDHGWTRDGDSTFISYNVISKEI